MTAPTPRQRYRGSLLGLACGDAIGESIEGRKTGFFTPVSDMPMEGNWTDDTAMALCLADSLVTMGGFDPIDQLTRYVRWMDDGYLSARGYCEGIGITTRASLAKFKLTREPFGGPTDPQTAGNGSIMRLAPIPLAFLHKPDVLDKAADSSRTTHGAPEAVDACRYMASIFVSLLNGMSREEALAPGRGSWGLCPGVAEVAHGSFWRREPPEIKGTGYVVRSLEAALWAFSRAKDCPEAILRAVNLGDDADTTGAICGQLAGAYWGEEGIPERWRNRLNSRDAIERYADRLLSLAGS